MEPPVYETRPADMAMSRAWTERLAASSGAPPVAFTLDGRRIAGLPPEWKPIRRSRRIDANIVETVFEAGDPAASLTVRIERLDYLDHPVVEWTAWFENRGDAPTPVIADILAMDATLAGASPVLWHCNGDFCSGEGYAPRATPVRPGDALSFAPNGGRPRDGAFPYFRLMFEGCGVSLAVGWPGQWAASFDATPGGVRVRAGQQETGLRLMPGEAVRTPRMTLLSWAGDAERAVNLWRRWYLAHVLPRPDGRPLRPLLACCGTDEGDEFTAATGENQPRYMDEFRARGVDFDVWWIDAGWYPCRGGDGVRKWWTTGTWRPDPERFPRGFAPVSARARELGARLLVWFEPERVRPGTELDHDHPEWLLQAAGDDNRLLNLGDPECRQWLTDHVCRLIRENGIGVYRQDHNFPPLAHWRENEAPDRRGINENLHVQGYLRFWDDLLERNPGLWIDSCASGGRRNDLETMRRAVPLHYSDYGYGNHPVKLAFQRTLHEWIPYFKESTLAWDSGDPCRFDAAVDPFAYHCGMAPMLFVTLDIRRDDYDFGLARRLIVLWRRAAGAMAHGDYHPLTPFHTDPARWVARQFDLPREGRGLVQAFRLPACGEETFRARLRGLRPDTAYRVEDPDGVRGERSGASLMEEGIAMALPRRGAGIWFYEAAGDARPGEG